jgi:hypothetical protein
MEITELPPTRFDLPGRGDPVYIATQRWVLERREGEDQPALGLRRSRKASSAPLKPRLPSARPRTLVLLIIPSAVDPPDRRRSLPGAGAVKGLVRRTSKMLWPCRGSMGVEGRARGGMRPRILEPLTGPVEG